MLRFVPVLLVAAAASVSCAEDAPPHDPQKDLKALQGKWQLTDSLLAETAVLKQLVPDHQNELKVVRFEGNRLRLASEGKSLLFANAFPQYLLKEPTILKHRLIMFTLDNGQAVLASYRLEEDDLTIMVPAYACNRTASTLRWTRVKD